MEHLSAHQNLKLLWWLRNIAMTGQIVAILVVTYALRIPLQTTPLYLIIAGSMGLNGFTWWRFRRRRMVSEQEFFVQLFLDMLALYGLLYCTGGATNPFASLFILQVVIAAVTLPAFYTWMTAGITVIFYTLLMFWNIEVPYFLHHHLGDFFSLHVQGMWIAFVLLALIVAWFIVRMNTTIRRQDALLAEAEKMASLGTMATGAAHELGTPLATMAVLAEEADPETARRLQEQIKRCKQILFSITAAGGVARAESGAPMQLDRFLETIVADWAQANPGIQLETSLQGTGHPCVLAEHGFRQVLINLLDNAADASPLSVTLEASWTPQVLRICIRDQGNGMPEAIKQSIGAAGITTKQDGLGLGIFLAKSVMARLGGTLAFKDAPDQGTLAMIHLPLKRIAV